jgi:serine/threonine protein kinase
MQYDAIGGELFDFVVNRGTLNEGEASLMLKGVTSALAYMHGKLSIHIIVCCTLQCVL